MPDILKLRGGTTGDHSGYVGPEREVTVDTDLITLRVHDGYIIGGVPLAREDKTPAATDATNRIYAAPEYTVSGLPSAGSHSGGVVYVSNGAAGTPVLAFSDGTAWLRCDTLAAVSAT